MDEDLLILYKNVLTKYKHENKIIKKLEQITLTYINSNKVKLIITEKEFENPMKTIPNYTLPKTIITNNYTKKENTGNKCIAKEWAPKGEINRCSRNSIKDSKLCVMHQSFQPFGIICE
jgi:hypothetical protein